ncbi:MAG TPA: RNA-binding S4 domain-containing protein [Casimicrobiaceae bacterium]|nr:RNA-binding S4 domain-containing protein [Casimicrobiaceae bacterium]
MTDSLQGNVSRSEDERIRIDKWLWTARFYRTRTLAADAIESGQVRIDDARVKRSHPVRIGSRVNIRKGDLAWDVEVLGVSERRGPAPDAARLYHETSESAEARERMLAARANARSLRASGRPTKRDRRKLQDFLNEP